MGEQPLATNENDGGLWDGIKNFAGSMGGRMLLGGLETVSGVGLIGKNIRKPLENQGF